MRDHSRKRSHPMIIGPFILPLYAVTSVHINRGLWSSTRSQRSLQPQASTFPSSTMQFRLTSLVVVLSALGALASPAAVELDARMPEPCKTCEQCARFGICTRDYTAVRLPSNPSIPSSPSFTPRIESAPRHGLRPVRPCPCRRACADAMQDL
jgi:hypothetical protein